MLALLEMVMEELVLEVSLAGVAVMVSELMMVLEVSLAAVSLETEEGKMMMQVQ